MDERGGVDHLGDLRQAAMTRGQLTIGRQGAGNQQNNARPQALATSAEQVLGRGLKDRVSSADQAAQVTEQGLEIGLDRLQQLGNGDHESPRRRDPSGHGLSAAAVRGSPQAGHRARRWHGWRSCPDPP